jgi:hypothetical protein
MLLPPECFLEQVRQLFSSLPGCAKSDRPPTSIPADGRFYFAVTICLCGKIYGLMVAGCTP